MTNHTQLQTIREQLIKHIKGGEAFMPIDQIAGDISHFQAAVVPKGLPYSIYQLMYHIRYAQADIIDYCQNADYHAPEWPGDYWPEESAPADEESWMRLVEEYIREREQFCELLLDPTSDVTKPLEANKDHNLLRQAELIIEHTAYHTGQIQLIRRLLNS